MSDPFPPASFGQEPEYLGSSSERDGTDGTDGTDSTGSRSGRRWGVLAAGAAGVVLAAGVGSWGVAQLLSGGASPATAVPAIAVAYLGVDLDPSAGQKIEALRMLKKFPALDEKLDLGVRDDLRRWVFEQIREQDACPGLDYAEDVEPWLGNRMAVAAVPDDDAPLAPLLVVQVSDRDAAAKGVVALQECAVPAPDGGQEHGPAGVAFVGDYMLVTEEQDDADALATAAEAAPLAADPAFSGWMEEIGEPGVVTAYVGSQAPQLFVELAKHEAKLLRENQGGAGSGMDPFGSDMGFGMYGDASRSLWKDFGGMAGVLRFSDGSLEAEAVAKGLPAGVASGGEPSGPALGDLPDTTAAAFTVSLPDGWLQGYLDTVEGMLGANEPGGFWEGIEAQTGLALPEDIEALLGDGVSISVDASADLESAFDSGEAPRIPVALRINGDPSEITRVLDLLKAQLGPAADLLVVEQSDEQVVVGLQQEYVDRLLGDGTLGQLDAFADVLPDADRASAALFVNFDAGDGWLDALAEGDNEAAANLAPLDGLGVSTWRDGDIAHGLLRLTTD